MATIMGPNGDRIAVAKSLERRGTAVDTSGPLELSVIREARKLSAMRPMCVSRLQSGHSRGSSDRVDDATVAYVLTFCVSNATERSTFRSVPMTGRLYSLKLRVCARKPRS